METKPIVLITNHRVARVILCAALFTVAFSVMWYGIEDAATRMTNSSGISEPGT